VASRKTGDWAQARDAFESMAVKMGEASQTSITQEAHYLRGEMIKGLQDQAPGGKAFKPLSPLTLAARRLAGFRGTKALMVHGDLRNGIRVESLGKGKGSFIGILRTARTDEGKNLINIAEVQELGAGPFTIAITDKVRRYLGLLFKELHGDSAIPRPFWLLKAKENAKRVLIMRIPARPFIRPIFEAFAKPEDVKRRLEERMAKLLKGTLSK
jgi:hypothetical protein